MVKKLTARERYRQIIEKQASKSSEGEALTAFTAPSGMTFKLRRPNVGMFVNMGTLPMVISSTKQDSEAAFKSLPPDKQVKLVEQSANLVRYICVDPKIVDEPTKDDEIAPEDVTLEDFNALVTWASGGDEAESLKNFR